MISFEGIKKVHCVGIGGIGVSAVAQLLHARGVSVSGSDVEESFIIEELRRAGITVAIGHKKENVPSDADLVIYTPAASGDNEERAAARQAGIQEMSYPQFLGELSRAYQTIAVSGTHGKSTVTAMIGLILEAAGLDPVVIVGSRVPLFPRGNVRVGEGNWFVVEACEHQGNMRLLTPWIAVINAIEEDHLDYYQDINHIVQAFQEFVNATRQGGYVIQNADDERVASLGVAGKYSVTFGINGTGDWSAACRRVQGGQQFFDMFYKGVKMNGEWSVRVPGVFNVQNALAAAAAAHVAGVSSEIICNALARFPGIWRRFERLGVMQGTGAHVISDYAHHPTAIRVTLEAAAEQFPGHRLVLIFQPHQHNRTKKLFDGFVDALALADVLIGVEIYDVAGRESGKDQDVSTLDLVSALEERGKSGARVPETAVYASGLHEAEELARELVRPDDVVIVMGAGDVWKVAGALSTS